MSEEKKEEKKKLIVVKSWPGNKGKDRYNLGSSSTYFAFVAKSPNGERVQATGCMTCREYFCRTLHHFLRGDNDSYYNKDFGIPIDMENLRILIARGPKNVEEYKRRLFNGKAALNILEDLAGFSRSTITTVKHGLYEGAWMLTGPREWLSQPQLLSLATWVLRVVSDFGPIDVTDYDSVEESFRLLSKKSEFAVSDVCSFCKQFWNKMYILLRFRREIFKGMSLDDAWKHNDSDLFSPNNGFYTFCAGTPNYSPHANKAQKTFQELCKEYLPRKNPKEGQIKIKWQDHHSGN